MIQISEFHPKNIWSILFQKEVKKLDIFFLQTYVNIVMWRLKIVVYVRELHVYRILFYHVHWFLNLLLQKSVVNLLSLKCVALSTWQP